MFRDKPLAGLRILDLGVIGAGPIGPTLLAEFGAEVIKIEHPKAGDLGRRIPPFSEDSSLWWVVDGRNKKSLAIDIGTKEGQEIIRQLVRISDVVVENFRPGTLEKWHLGYEELKKLNPGIILIRVTGFGQEGPYINRTSYDPVGQAMGGIIYLTGYPDHPPVRPGLYLCDDISATFNAFAAMLALYYRGKKGTGQWAEVVQYETIFRLSGFTAPAYDKLGIVRERVGNRHPSMAPYDIFTTKDDQWVVIAVGNDKIFARLAEAMGRYDLPKDPRFENISKRAANSQTINHIVAQWVRNDSLEEVLDILEKADVPVSPIYSIKEIFEDPHYQARDNIIEIGDPAMGSVKVPNIVPKFSLTPGRVEDTGPALGQHNEEIFAKLVGNSTGPGAGTMGGRVANSTGLDDEILGSVSIGDQKGETVEGLRILELGTGLAGSFAASLLADFGAEVIKVEEPGVGDPLRHTPPFYNNLSLWWSVEGRNKKAITLDLRVPEGQGIFKQLASISDIVVESFLPGTLEKWAIGYEILAELNPKIILLRISGFGQSGPYSRRPSYDAVASAFGGFTYITGYPDSPPVRPGLELADYLSGLFGALGIMIALYYRDVRKTGKGQWIDLALYEPLRRFSHHHIPAYHKLGLVEERAGNKYSIVGPADNFKTKDQQWITIVVAEDKDFARLMQAIGQEQLACDPRFETLLKRSEHTDVLNEIVRQWVNKNTLSEIVEALADSRVPFSPIYDVKQIFEDPHYRARNNIIEVNDPGMGKIKMPDVVPKLLLTPGIVKNSGPALGQHNDEILMALLGYTREEINILGTKGII